MVRGHKKCGIYGIQNSINGKVYIGSSVNVSKRLNAHLLLLKKNNHHSILLQRAWNKYGAESFNFELIQDIKERSELIKNEQKWIDFLSPEYNICKIAGTTSGVFFSDEARRKIGHMKGKSVSEETKKKMSEAQKGCKNHRWGKTATEEQKKKISIKSLGNKSNTGRTFTEDHRNNIRLGLKNRYGTGA